VISSPPGTRFARHPWVHRLITMRASPCSAPSMVL
jgi:hypothetical protein